LNALVAAIGQDGLTTVLLYHAVGVVAYSTDLSNGPLTTVSGQDLTVDLTNGVRFLDVDGDPATVTVANVRATNGIIHGINAVLVPTL
jgi:uncharacterized surface protein with fasciclin (FAS1) repeats